MKVKIMQVGPIGTNCYFLMEPEENVLAIIDPGDEAQRIQQVVNETGCKVQYILLTHGHYDHVGSVNELSEKLGAKIVGGAQEMPVFTDPALNVSQFVGAPIIVHPDELVNEGDVVKVGDMEFKVMLTPGHTQGSICFIEKDVIFSGDTLFQGSCGRTDLPTGDWNAIRLSLKRLAALPGDYKVYSGHGPATTLEEERRTNPFMKK